MKQAIEGFSTGAEPLYVQTFWQSMMQKLVAVWCATHWRKSGQRIFAGAVLVLLMPLVKFKPFLFPNACT